MPQAERQPIPFYALFKDPMVRDAFRRAERDQGAAPLAVSPTPRPVITGGAVVREMADA